MPAAQRQPLPMDAQLAKLERILADRVKLYRLSVKKGAKTLDEAAEKHAECGDILRTFRWLAANIVWIKAEAARRRDQARQQAEADALRAELETHPDVAAVREQFPGATIAGVRPLAAAANEDFSEEEHTP